MKPGKKRYVEKYKEEPGVGTAVGTYTSAMIWAQAVERAGDEKNYKEVCRVIREYSYNITGVTHVFDPHTQSSILGEGLSPFLVFQVQDQKHHELVSPISLATEKIHGSGLGQITVFKQVHRYGIGSNMAGLAGPYRIRPGSRFRLPANGPLECCGPSRFEYDFFSRLL